MNPPKVYACHACSSKDIRLIDGEPADWYEPYDEPHEIRPAYVVCAAWPGCAIARTTNPSEDANRE